MKRNLLAHPMFKPFSDLTQIECEGISLGREHHWSKVTKKDGTVIEDYSIYNDKYNEVFEYFGLNVKWFYKECGFSYENYGEAFDKLIALRLKDFGY